MGNVDKSLLAHWEAQRWRRHESDADNLDADLDADLEQAVARALGHIDRQRAAISQCAPRLAAVELDDR